MRIKFSLKLAFRHFYISIVVACITAFFIFKFIYPWPTDNILGVWRIYSILLMVDVVSGPLLTLVVASPHKSRRELIIDISAIAMIQALALVYGLYTLYVSRPVAFVFEQDRVVVVARNEILEENSEKSDSSKLDKWGVRWFNSRIEGNGVDKLKSLEFSLQGVSPAMRPETWSAWDWNDAKLQSTLRPLMSMSADQKEKLSALRGGIYMGKDEMVYLPMVSSKNLEWIAVFDKNGVWLDALPVDGFLR
ncbi:hypothetical protein [Comamonas sp. B-9]|uniref:hypothetical protein n=1 Tax=Comamonas sp. B-9 TaxID=1055192 RepID=UPI0011DCA2E5|nr:hypothetical protein [Comamonas sp. B-9]